VEGRLNNITSKHGSNWTTMKYKIKSCLHPSELKCFMNILVPRASTTHAAEKAWERGRGVSGSWQLEVETVNMSVRKSCLVIYYRCLNF
jgi:hypothetical protein